MKKSLIPLFSALFLLLSLHALGPRFKGESMREPKAGASMAVFSGASLKKASAIRNISYAPGQNFSANHASSTEKEDVLSGHMTAITQKPRPAAPTEISNPDWSFLPCDREASMAARSVLVCLEGLSRQYRVIFGHQNDTLLHVREGVLSDVEDMTGDISGLVGFDALSLSGDGREGMDPDTCLVQMVSAAEDTSERGAILSMSAHIPNLSSPKIRVLEDGSHDFSLCTTNTSKDLSNDCAAESLPGGKYNEIFCEYLDIMARYFLALQEKEIAVLFRPFHEGNGNWFWWGTCTDSETYRSLYRYTADYLKQKGVHNLLYVYSVSGAVTDAGAFLDRYPGDSYVDIMAFDLYDDYRSAPFQYNPRFFERLEESCQLLHSISQKHNKVSAISETGIWVLKEDGSDYQGLLPSGNPILGKNWYGKIGEIAINNQISYFMVWNSSSPKSTHLPYKVSDSAGHELTDDFIRFYNEDYSLFASEIILPRP